MDVIKSAYGFLLIIGTCVYFGIWLNVLSSYGSFYIQVLIVFTSLLYASIVIICLKGIAQGKQLNGT